MINGLVCLDKIVDVETQTLVREAAAKDGHSCFGASHAVFKNGEIVGWASLAMLPVVCCWLDTEKVKARDTLQALNLAEHDLKARGIKEYVMLCAEDSPLYDAMPTMGFERKGPTVMFTKKTR